VTVGAVWLWLIAADALAWAGIVETVRGVT
jgi:hypothetical protein